LLSRVFPDDSTKNILWHVKGVLWTATQGREKTTRMTLPCRREESTPDEGPAPAAPANSCCAAAVAAAAARPDRDDRDQADVITDGGDGDDAMPFGEVNDLTTEMASMAQLKRVFSEWAQAATCDPRLVLVLVLVLVS
jgi:hypothetical protein